jgi:hypothetical protein
MIWIDLLHWICAVIVAAEALNKIERSYPLQRGLSARARFVLVLKVLAWCLLAIGAGGALVTPLLRLETPTLQDAAVMGGFALLIIRSRFKEGCPA